MVKKHLTSILLLFNICITYVKQMEKVKKGRLNRS